MYRSHRPEAALRTLAVLMHLAMAGAGFAADSRKKHFDVPADIAARSLKVFARQSGLEVLIQAELGREVQTHAVRGEMTSREAIDVMLRETGLVVDVDDKNGVFAVRRKADAQKAGQRMTPRSAADHAESNPHPRFAARVGGIFSAIGTPRRGVGAVEGRVLNATTGNYLNNARVSVEGTTIETFTNAYGEYRLVDVPAGWATLHAVYTGLAAQTARLQIPAGAGVTHDFGLARGRRSGSEGDAIVLDSLVISAGREVSGRELALNEQRFAANFKNVVSADEFGDTAEGNVGEFLKFLPGVTIDYVGADARNISLRGLPPHSTPVMVDGAPMASAASSLASRVFELEQVSINNVSRVEVTKSSTPDMPASATGGAINMISRSAFERARPLFMYRAYLNWNTDEPLLRRTAVGPSRHSSVHTNPSFDFTYLRPVNRDFGFTITGAYSDQYAPDYRAQPVWAPGGTGSALASTDNPFLRNFTIFYGPKVTQRTSVGSTIDWRVSPASVLSFSVQWNDYDAFFSNKSANINTLGSLGTVPPAAWGRSFTQSQPGAGTVSFGGSTRRKSGTTQHLSLRFVHEGRHWSWETGATYSNASNHYRDADRGHVNGSSISLTQVTLLLSDIDRTTGIPRSVAATTAAGTPVGWERLGVYRINHILFNQLDSRDVVTSARSNVKRDVRLPLLRAPVALKVGVDARQMSRDIQPRLRARYDFVGPDGITGAASADDVAGRYDLVNAGFRQAGRPRYGEPWLEYPSAHKLYDLFVASPAFFREDVPFRIQNEAAESRKLTEAVSAGYLRTDWRMLNNRLRIVGGARHEHTRVAGYGLRNDPTALYQRDAAGNLLRGANGLPVRIAGLDAAAAAQLQFTPRGAYARRSYDGIYPSLAVVVEVTRDLLLRASYARSLTRPNLEHVIPGVTISDPAGAGGAIPLISINNPGLKPWTAKNVDLGIEYYFGEGRGNVIALGTYRKDMRDFFGVRRTEATPAGLASFGLDETYMGYELEYKFNAGNATLSGGELSYRHGLERLPYWARGLDVFYNVTVQRLEGTTLSDFNNFVRRNDNYGITLSRPRFTVRLKVNDRGRQRLVPVTGANIAPGAHRYQAPKRMLDVDLEYRLRRELAFFVAGRNVTDTPSTHQETYGLGTPRHARTVQYWKHAVNYVMGFKGSF
jgi:iron complex outermembrane recepter protein